MYNLQGMSSLRSLIPFTPPSVHASIVPRPYTLDLSLQLYKPDMMLHSRLYNWLIYFTQIFEQLRRRAHPADCVTVSIR